MRKRFGVLIVGATILLGGVSVAASEPVKGGMSCVIAGFAGSEAKSICVQKPVVVSTVQIDPLDVFQLASDDQFDVFIPTVDGGTVLTRRALKFDSDKRPKALLKRAVDLVSTCLKFKECPEQEFWESAEIILARCAEDHEYYLLDSPLMLSLLRPEDSEQTLNQVFGEMLECHGKDETLFISSNKFLSSKTLKRGSTYYDAIRISDANYE